MHPDVRSAVEGTCTICGMTLVALDSRGAGDREYDVDVETIPDAVVPGRPFRLQLTVRQPGSSVTVSDFVEVHERRFHLFLISQDLEHYAHVHPEQRADGAWVVDVTVPQAGYYNVYSDFLPRGGTPQVVVRSVMTDGFPGTVASSSARLVPDRSLRRSVDSMTVSLDLEPGGLVAGREQKFTYFIREAITGAPATDLEPYLGAWGHSLVISEDTMHVVHAHPVEEVQEGGHPEGGGPALTFKAMLPKPGNYRIWTQFKRGGKVSTAVFTVRVAEDATQ